MSRDVGNVIVLSTALVLFSPLATWLGDKEELGKALIKGQLPISALQWTFVLLAVILFWDARNRYRRLGFRKPH